MARNICDVYDIDKGDNLRGKIYIYFMTEDQKALEKIFSEEMNFRVVEPRLRRLISVQGDLCY